MIRFTWIVSIFEEKKSRFSSKGQKFIKNLVKIRKFGQNTNQTLISVDPTSLQEIQTKYTKH